MKTEIKLLIILAITFLIILVFALNFAQPSALSAATLVACIILVFLVVRGIKSEPSSSHGLTKSPSSSKSPQWSERTGDSDNLVDRLVSAVEELVREPHKNERSLDGAKLRRELHQRLGYVVEESTGYQLVGQTKEVTVLFSDLRGFTVTTEGFSASEVVNMLNRYFTHMCEIIYRHGGTVDKFMGDSIMALFGAPVSRSNDIERAVCSAVEMQIRMDAFNEENKKLGLPNFYMGIGINTGEVVAGKIGSDLHSEYTVIGDEVNLTSRIEANALRGQVLISHKTYTMLKDLVKVGDPIYVSVKGMREQVALYELLEIGEPYNLKVPEREARRSPRAGVNMPFKFQTLEGKIVRPGVYEGLIQNISSEGMLASTHTRIEPHLNVIFRLNDNAFADESDDIYGRIVRVNEDEEDFSLHIEFTAISPKDRTAVKNLVNQILSGYVSSA